MFFSNILKNLKHKIELMGSPVRWGKNPHKHRSYKLADTRLQFQKIEKERKVKTLALLQQREGVRKKLLQQLQRQRALPGSEGQTKEVQTQDSQKIDLLRKELNITDERLSQFQSEMMVVDGHKKDIVLVAIQYYRTMYMLLTGSTLHPETMKLIEQVNYLVSNGLPVHRFKIYTICPELFVHEIGELDAVKRKLVEEGRIKLDTSKSDFAVFDGNGLRQSLGLQPEIIQIQQEIIKYEWFYYNKEVQFYKNYNALRDALVAKGFFPDYVWDHILYKPVKSQLEQACARDLLDLRQERNNLAKFIQLSRQKMEVIAVRPVVPPYVRDHPQLMSFFQKRIKQIQDNMVPLIAFFPEITGLPTSSQAIRQRLEKEGIDIDKMEADAFQDYKLAIGNEQFSEERLVAVIKKYNPQYLRAQEIYEEYQTGLLQSSKKELEDKSKQAQKQLPKDKKVISYDYIPKLLYLNNSDPAKYSLQFFAQELSTGEDALRQIFQHLSYPYYEQQKLKVLKFKYQ